APGGVAGARLDGVGHAVVLAGLPDDRVAVVLAAVVDRHPHPKGQGGLPLPHALAAVVAVLVGGDPVAGVELVEGLLGVAFGGGSAKVGGGVGGRGGGGAAAVVPAAEAVGDLWGWPVLELMAGQIRRGLQVGQQLGVAVGPGPV